VLADQVFATVLVWMASRGDVLTTWWSLSDLLTIALILHMLGRDCGINFAIGWREWICLADHSIIVEQIWVISLWLQFSVLRLGELKDVRILTLVNSFGDFIIQKVVILIIKFISCFTHSFVKQFQRQWELGIFRHCGSDWRLFDVRLMSDCIWIVFSSRCQDRLS
jgi:hypothetical protein